jgi:[ribosomal protein S5]-alanine N-acetyltransferase
MIDALPLPEIKADRVKLRELTEVDVPSLYAVFSNPDVMRYWSSEPIATVDDARALLDEIHACSAAKTLFQWGVAMRDDDRVIGTCTLFHLDERNRRGEIGYALARDQWGKGLMQEALTALLDYVFGTLNLHRIEADVDPGNSASLRLLERLGFRREGLLCERWLVGGAAQDSVLLGLLSREWSGGRPPNDRLPRTTRRKARPIDDR